ncbi:M20 family metallopeptidase [Faecalicatena orotica]|uniref:M20 family metallopeptidase n=1 Tax=Faecalicatena orotica TaxID=1544 RepID=UPI0032163351
MKTTIFDAVTLTQQLIRIESTNPGTYEREIGTFISDYLKGAGVEPERSEGEDGRFNIRAVIKGRKKTPALVFICHMDTVVTGDGWKKNPFSGEIQDGRIYGRGACDMKSGLACALTVFAEMAQAVKEGAVVPEYPLMFIGTSDEEGDMTGVERVVAEQWVTKNDWIVDMEPTDGNIQMSHKGRTWFEVEVKGVTAHASMPEKGADAIAGMAAVLTYIRSKIKKCPVHEELGPSTVTFGQIGGGYSPYVVPDSCRATIDMRLAPPMNTEKAADLVQSAIRYGEEQVPGVHGSYRITGDRPSVETHEDSVLLKELEKAVEETTKTPPGITVFPGYTDTAVIAGKLGNRNCMSYGPGSLQQAHKPDEFVNTTEIDRCQEVFRKLVRNMLTAGRAL